MVHKKIVLWDNDGTIQGSRDPHDRSATAKIILPGVKEAMAASQLNCVISGFKSPESEAQNFDPDMVIKRLTDMMSVLPISAAAFSPAIGGVACYVVIKDKENIIVKNAHEDARYHEYVGKFKKPDIGMFYVMRDVVQEYFGEDISKDTTVMIGDTWHDEAAARSFGIDFIEARLIHEAPHAEKL